MKTTNNFHRFTSEAYSEHSWSPFLLIWNNNKKCPNYKIKHGQTAPACELAAQNQFGKNGSVQVDSSAPPCRHWATFRKEAWGMWRCADMQPLQLYIERARSALKPAMSLLTPLGERTLCACVYILTVCIKGTTSKRVQRLLCKHDQSWPATASCVLQR